MLKTSLYMILICLLSVDVQSLEGRCTQNLNIPDKFSFLVKGHIQLYITLTAVQPLLKLHALQEVCYLGKRVIVRSKCVKMSLDNPLLPFLRNPPSFLDPD